MTRYLLFFILLGFGFHTSAQKIYLPVKVKHQWGFLEVTEKTSKLDRSRLYDNLGDINLPWFGREDSQSGYYLVEKNGKLGLVTAAFELVIQPAWDEIHPISQQYFLVAKAGAYNIIDEKGKPLLKGDDFQSIKLAGDKPLSFFMLMQNGQWGVQKRGQSNWSIKPEYDALEFLDVGTEGLFKVKKDKVVDGKWTIIDWRGTNLPALKHTFARIEAVGQYHIATQEIRRKTDWSIRDLSGKEVLILGPEAEIKTLNQHLFAYKEKGSSGYSVLVMRQKISPLVEKFDDLQEVNGDLVFYRMGEKSGFIYSDGSLHEIETGKHPVVMADEGDLIRIKWNEGEEGDQKWGIYSCKEKSLTQTYPYDSIAPLSGGHFARIMEDGKIGLINSAGKVIAPPQFDAIPYLGPNVDKIYSYWKDSVMVYPVDPMGNLSGPPTAEVSTALLGPERYYWPDYTNTNEAMDPVATGAPAPEPEEKESLWQALTKEDTLWIEEGKSYWHSVAGNYQLMQQEEVEVVVREKSSAASKKKKKKRKKGKSAPRAPKKTKTVLKWVEKGTPYVSLRKASPVNWTLAYQDNNGLVSNELTTKGRTRYSARRISVFLNETNTLLPEPEMIGIRLSDFKDGLTYAAFMDLDGKIGLIDKDGKQAADTDGKPLRFTYLSKASEGKIQACHASADFSQLGLKTSEFLTQFDVALVNASGSYTSELKSSKPGLWGYIDPSGKTLIPFEYSLVTPFQNDIAINQQDGKWGAINDKNEAVVPFDYDAIYQEKDHWKVVKGNEEAEIIYYDDRGRRFDNKEHAGLAVQGHRLFRVQDHSNEAKFGYVDINGNTVIPHQFDEASHFQDGLATVRIERKWFFIDETGKEVISIDPEIIGIIEVGNFSEGLCPIRKTTILNKKSTRKYGYLNKEGKLAIPAKFDRAGEFQGGLAVVASLNFSEYKSGQDGRIPQDLGLIDKQGNPVTDYEFKQIDPFNAAGFAVVEQAKTGKQGILGKDGKILTETYYSRVKSFKDGMAGSDGTYWKVFDYAGQEITLPMADVTSVRYFADGDLLVRDKSDLWHHYLVVSKDGAEIKQGGFQSLQAFEGDYALARMEKQNMLYGRNQSRIPAEKGNTFKFWSNNLIGIKNGETEFYANPGLQNVFARNFDMVNKFTSQCAVVSYRGQSGVINSRGVFMVPPKFEEISWEEEGNIKVMANGRKYGLLSKSGKELIPAQYDTIRHLPNGIIQVEYADFVGYYRANGEVLWGLDK